MNKHFLLSFDDKAVDTQRIFFKTEIKEYKVMIDGGNNFNQPGKIDRKKVGNIIKNCCRSSRCYTIGFLLNYLYCTRFK